MWRERALSAREWLCPVFLVRGGCRALPGSVTLLHSACRVFGVALLRSAPVQGVSRPPHTASRDCRNGSPLARAIPCAPAPEYGDTRKKEKSGRTMRPRSGRQPAFFVSDPTRSAASRAGMAGWAGEGGGRFGERREYEAPILPSTPRQHGSAHHNKSQAINSTPCQHSTPPPPPTSASTHLPIQSGNCATRAR